MPWLLSSHQLWLRAGIFLGGEGVGQMTRSEGKRMTGNHYPHSSGEGDPACLALPSTLTHAAAVIVPVTHQPRNPGIKTEEFYPQTNFRTHSPAPSHCQWFGSGPHPASFGQVPPNWSSCLQSTHYSSFSELLPVWSFGERSQSSHSPVGYC